MKNILILALLLTGFSSCSNYYRAITASEPTKAASYNDLQDNKKYYILRNGSEAFAMKNISISSDRKNLECTLESLPMEHQLYIRNGSNGKSKYRKAGYDQQDETVVLNEVHIYITPGVKTEPGKYSLAFENIQKAELIEKDKVKTQKSHVLGTILGVSGALIIAGGLVGLVGSTMTIF